MLKENRRGGAMLKMKMIVFPLLLISCLFWVELTVCAAEPVGLKNADYTIGIGDVLSINTWKEEGLSFDTVQVRNDGKITFPLLDDIPADGKTTIELKKIIQKKLSEFVESPSVTITLVNPISQKFYILGEVQAVGEYPLVKKLTIVQAFALAEGFTEWASKDKIILYRRSGQKEEMIKIDYNDIVKGQLNKDILLRADDIIIVP
jgi:polysaccharide biosynthesis/export protein